MAIVAKASGGSSDFVPAPQGVHAAVCCDVVDLGILEVAFGGKKKKQHKVRIVWQTEDVRENNRPYEVSKRYTLSLHEKAALRKDLESWRGKPFTPQELQGFDLEVLIGAPAFLNVIHNDRDGTTYANIASIMRLPKSMQAPTIHGYVRVCDRNHAEPVGGDEPLPADEWGGITDDDIPF